MVIYLDDILVMSEFEAKAEVDRDAVISTLEMLGFMINNEKYIFQPCQTLEYLRVIIGYNFY